MQNNCFEPNQHVKLFLKDRVTRLMAAENLALLSQE